MKTRQRAAGPRSEWPRRLAWSAFVPPLVMGLLLASVALPPVAAPAQELNAPAATPLAPGSATRTRPLIAPLLGLASPPGAAATPTPAQIRAAVAAVNTLLLAPEPAPAASGAAGALALALLAGGRLLRRRS